MEPREYRTPPNTSAGYQCVVLVHLAIWYGYTLKNEMAMQHILDTVYNNLFVPENAHMHRDTWFFMNYAMGVDFKNIVRHDLNMAYMGPLRDPAIRCIVTFLGVNLIADYLPMHYIQPILLERLWKELFRLAIDRILAEYSNNEFIEDLMLHAQEFVLQLNNPHASNEIRKKQRTLSHEFEFNSKCDNNISSLEQLKTMMPKCFNSLADKWNNGQHFKHHFRTFMAFCVRHTINDPEAQKKIFYELAKNEPMLQKLQIQTMEEFYEKATQLTYLMKQTTLVSNCEKLISHGICPYSQELRDIENMHVHCGTQCESDMQSRIGEKTVIRNPLSFFKKMSNKLEQK